MTNYGVNFMLVSWSFPTEPAMPFSGILPCREYFGAMHEGYRQLRTPVTLMPFCRLVTVVMISYDAKYHDGVLILSTSPTVPFSSIITISWVAWRTWYWHKRQNYVQTVDSWWPIKAAVRDRHSCRLHHSTLLYCSQNYRQPFPRKKPSLLTYAIWRGHYLLE